MRKKILKYVFIAGLMIICCFCSVSMVWADADSNRLKAEEADFRNLEDMLEFIYTICDEEFDYANADFKDLLFRIIQTGYDSAGYGYFFQSEGETIVYGYDKPDPKKSLYYEDLGDGFKLYYYMKLDASRVDWIAENIFHVQPDHNFGLNYDYDEYHDGYYEDCYYYFLAGDAGYIGHTVTVVDYKALSNNQYYITLEYNLNPKENLGKNQNYMLADLQNIDGKRQWTIYKNSKTPFEADSLATADSGTASRIGVMINGEPVEFTSDSGQPFVDSASRTQVPLRVTMESCGLTVNWDQAAQTASVTDGDVLVEVPIGQSYILKNGERIQNDTAAVIIDQRTYLPIRVVLEAFGADVDWDQSDLTVQITYASQEQPSEPDQTDSNEAEQGETENGVVRIELTSDIYEDQKTLYKYYEYATIIAYSEAGDIVWSYETPKFIATELTAVTELCKKGDCYYFVEDSSIVCMDVQSGSILWKNDDYAGRSAGFVFGENAIYLCGYYGPDFYAISYSGETLARIDQFDPNYYWAGDIALQGERAAVYLYGGPTGYGDPKIFYVDLNTYVVTSS